MALVDAVLARNALIHDLSIPFDSCLTIGDLLARWSTKEKRVTFQVRKNLIQAI